MAIVLPPAEEPEALAAPTLNVWDWVSTTLVNPLPSARPRFLFEGLSLDVGLRKVIEVKESFRGSKAILFYGHNEPRIRLEK